MSFPFQSYDYAALSISDLLEARDLYHLHLLNKKNVVATAIGYYRIRKVDDWPSREDPNPGNQKSKHIPRRLGNSEIRPYSWPAILVFVEKWEQEEALIGSAGADIIPRTLYLPDGKAVPVCVIEAEKVAKTADTINLADLQFPRNVISGGFPLITDIQQETRIASFGCLVTDGHMIYALTNKHVTGKKGTPIKTILGGTETVIGYSSELQIGKVRFEDMYPTLKGKSVFLNLDIGLVEVNDVNQWKTEIFSIGQFNQLIDLDTNNITLKLINQKVTGFGAASGTKIEGEIQALFYRYKSIGGFEYVCDFLIGPRTKDVPYKEGDSDKTLVVRHGDSGTLMLMEIEAGTIELDIKPKRDRATPTTSLHPFGVLWGMHEFINDTAESTQPYILASCLSTVCNLLDVEIVRDWNRDLTNTWGKTGHFKVGARACELVSDPSLRRFLMANQKNIGYTDAALTGGDVVTGKFTPEFVPLADVADIIWRSVRHADASNHFADVDETSALVMEGKSLLELSLLADKNIDIDFWLDYDKQMDVAVPMFKINPKTGQKKLQPRRGALPFRVWQLYNLMTKSVQEKDLTGFLVAGGTLSHYVGDACQPLHVSYLHHGRTEEEENVHSDYETTMIDKKMVALFTGVNKVNNEVDAQHDLIGMQGKKAARRVLQLMSSTVKNLSPMEVIDCWTGAKGNGRWDKMWDQLGAATIKNIAEGAKVMAILWQSAWENGKGNQQFKEKELKVLTPKELQKRYMDKNFAPSYSLDDTNKYKSVCY